MSYADVIVAFVLTVVLILGGYQIYFLPQKYPFKAARQAMLKVDEKIPFKPRWVWIYSLFYYPFIISTIWTVSDLREFTYVGMNFLLLLIFQLILAYIFPIKTPSTWRNYNPGNSLSERFLSLVHHFDKGGNCFPSMHVGTAFLTALHIYNNLSAQSNSLIYLVFIMPILISMSTLFTKQHYVIDIPAGAVLGFFVFSIHLKLF